MCDDAENLAGAGTEVRQCSNALGPRKNLQEQGDLYEVSYPGFPPVTKLDSQFIAMLNDETMNGFEDKSDGDRWREKQAVAEVERRARPRAIVKEHEW